MTKYIMIAFKLYTFQIHGWDLFVTIYISASFYGNFFSPSILAFLKMGHVQQNIQGIFYFFHFSAWGLHKAEICPAQGPPATYD